MFGLLFAALFHVGTLVRGRSRWAFTDSETTLLKLSSVLTRGHSAILGEVAPCSSLIYAYNILASLAVFAFWLMVGHTTAASLFGIFYPALISYKSGVNFLYVL